MEVSAAGVTATADKSGVDLSIQFGVPIVVGALGSYLGYKYAVKHSKNKWLFGVGGLVLASVATYVIGKYVIGEKTSAFVSNTDLNLGEQMSNDNLDLSGADGVKKVRKIPNGQSAAFYKRLGYAKISRGDSATNLTVGGTGCTLVTNTDENGTVWTAIPKRYNCGGVLYDSKGQVV